MTFTARRRLAALLTSAGTACVIAAASTSGAQAAPEPDPAPAPGAIQIKVLQYNIRFGEFGIENVAQDIKRTGAQVVLLNEVDDRRPSGGRHQSVVLGQRLKMQVAWDPNSRNRLGFRGNAILSSLPISGVERITLPAPAGTEPRGLMKVRVDAGTVKFDAWSTHLNPGAGKQLQANAVRDRIGAPACATLLGGDMNARPGSPEIASLTTNLRDLFARTGTGDGGTGSGGGRIDYLFLNQARGISATVLPKRNSDHRGLLGVVQMTPAKSC